MIEENEELPYGSKEWVEKYGFGVTTQWYPESMVAPEAVGYPDEGVGGEMETHEDPNAAYLDSLTESEQDAYYEALHGDEPEIDESMTEEEIDAAYEDYEPTGCYNTAWEEAFGGGQDLNTFYNTYGDEIEDMYTRMEADPRIVEAEEQVRSCVEGEGVTYVSETDAYEYFEPKLAELDNTLYGGEQAQVEPPEGFEEWSAEDQDAWWEENYSEPEVTSEQKAQLAELQKEEIDAAVANYNCGGGYQQQAKLYQEVMTDYENEFLETHADDLAQYEGSLSE